ncbi:MAG: metal ABC transporter ATP-binding protein [Magnetococcales bacterium]|nr:metal ABC transporter ATP-binding protein [Magnetococcales bacterium]MBF0321560.1 metal ABC transporter ATP-binding protein [Magnetococcales bacterium]
MNHSGKAAHPLVVARGVVLRLGKRPVLSGVDMSVASGEIVTIIGPNGAGKTTLIRVLLGLLRPEAGEVVQRPNIRIGYVPQRLPLDPILPLTVARFMTLTGRLSPSVLQAALAETGVEHLTSATVATLSGGELQRVLLARALSRKPDLLVLDEPVQGVDFAGEAMLYELIGTIRNRHGCGILLVSHDLHVVMGATDRVICLNGHICCAGAPASVSQDPEYTRLFGPHATSAYAFYAHQHAHQHAHTPQQAQGPSSPCSCPEEPV